VFSFGHQNVGMVTYCFDVGPTNRSLGENTTRAIFAPPRVKKISSILEEPVTTLRESDLQVALIACLFHINLLGT
jgi:hypothetical protein